MKIFRSRAAGALAAVAALSLTATPAMARGWHHYHDGDTGDVLAGLAIFGGIAAIAAAAASSSHKNGEARADDRDYPDDYRDAPPQRYDDRGEADRYDGERRDPGSYAPSGMSVDGAVDACLGAAEQGRRTIDGVESVNREGDGWRVQGRDRDGRDFACSVDRDGHIRGAAGA